jgi:hypothetical protein
MPILKVQLPSPWFDFLSDLDKALADEVEVICLGGFVLTLIHGAPRNTGDIDYLTVAPTDASAEIERLAGKESKLAKKYRIFFHRAGGVTDLPENYDERLSTLDVGLKRLSLKILDVYDLVLSKLTRNSPKDREDVKYLAKKFALNFSVLYDRYSREMKPWIPNMGRHEVTLNVVWKEYFSQVADSSQC